MSMEIHCERTHNDGSRVSIKAVPHDWCVFFQEKFLISVPESFICPIQGFEDLKCGHVHVFRRPSDAKVWLPRKCPEM